MFNFQKNAAFWENPEKNWSTFSEIQKKFMSALTDRSRAKFRAFMYQTLEKLSLEWETFEHVEDSKDQLGAFSREIATWICNQEEPFSDEDLKAMMMSTKRPFNQNLLLKVANNVNRQKCENKTYQK